MKFALVMLATLFVQTDNGNVSIQKDLTEHMCRLILGKIKCASDCFCIGVTEDGDSKYPPGWGKDGATHSCIGRSDAAHLRQGGSASNDRAPSPQE